MKPSSISIFVLNWSLVLETEEWKKNLEKKKNIQTRAPHHATLLILGCERQSLPGTYWANFYVFFYIFSAQLKGRWSPPISQKEKGAAGQMDCERNKLSDNTKRPKSLWLTFRSREASSGPFTGGSENRRPLRRRFVCGSRSLSYHLKLIKRKLLLLFWDRKCRQIKQRQQARLEAGAKFSPPQMSRRHRVQGRRNIVSQTGGCRSDGTAEIRSRN